jgi:hypothetical protein
MSCTQMIREFTVVFSNEYILMALTVAVVRDRTKAVSRFTPNLKFSLRPLNAAQNAAIWPSTPEKSCVIALPAQYWVSLLRCL